MKTIGEIRSKIVAYSGEVYEQYDVKIKTYSTGRVEVKEYEGKIERRIEGWEERKKEHVSKVIDDFENRSGNVPGLKELRSNNITRSYSNLVDYAMENHSIWCTFLTLTFAENITDLTLANKQFNIFRTQVKRKYPEFQYLGVPEFQKRGAVHYHLITNIPIANREIFELQAGKEKMYNVIQWKKGFTSVFDLSLADEKFSVAAYMSKYFFKDIDNRLFGRRKILASQGLKKPNQAIMNKESAEYKNYVEYLENNKRLEKEKLIESDSLYKPSFKIKVFANK